MADAMGAMKEHDADSPANPSVPHHSQHRLSTPISSRSYGSYETGESSPPVSFDGPTITTTLAQSRTDFDKSKPTPHTQSPGNKDSNHEAHRRRRSHKPRSSGGFLLSNTMLDNPSKTRSASRDDGRRRSRIPVDNRRPKTTPDKSNTTSFTRAGLGIDLEDGRRSSDGQGIRTLSRLADNGRRYSQNSQGSQDSQGSSRIPTRRSTPSPLDVDSTQIVNMALNLSESRRLAARRNISTPIPPRLAQLPESPAGPNIKQHLQQQRRASRTISPKPDKALTPRPASASKIPSPLQSAFDHESGYKYHFSSSTLNRSQKAREYLELMAQYRRLLQFISPLEQNGLSRPSSSNFSTSPTNTKSPLTGSLQIQLGRNYNPLQYIRNRKVRARERRVIDGEALGFSDIPMVSNWVDEAASSAAKSGLGGPASLPPFPGAHENFDQELPASNLPRPISTTRPKRPKIDWSIDPADMLADIYWLEQGDNKYLIEDRHYLKVFPHKPEPQTSALQQGTETVVSTFIKDDDVGDTVLGSEPDLISPYKPEFDVSHASARDRARQKLQDLRGLHHKQSGVSHNHHDFLRFRKGSLSDTSDSESDRKRRNRTGTISADGTDLLEKQFMDMLAKEANKEKQENPNEIGYRHLKELPLRMGSPEKKIEPLYSRRRSRIEPLESHDKINRGKVAQESPIGSGRQSLEVPRPSHRLSMDLEYSSQPPSRGRNAQIPTIGMDLSPPASRPESPSRKPFSKVKNIFRDRSRERERVGDYVIREKDDERVIDPPEPLNLAAVTAERFESPERRRSQSLSRKIVQRSTNESHKSHRSMGSIKLKGDEQVGLRGIFKGSAKLDGMIRGGVSKVTDLLWKQNSKGESDSSTSSSSDSDEEPKRGRLRQSLNLSRSSSFRHPRDSIRQKNYLEVMPPFKSTVSHEKPLAEETDSSVLTSPISRNVKSPRFDRLKPPRIDIRKASPPERTKAWTHHDPDLSDAESRKRQSITFAERPNEISPKKESDVSSIPPSQAISARPRLGSRALSQGARHWSISNRGSSPQGNQISRREVARLRTLILCSGIKAMEISRRSQEPHPIFPLDNKSPKLPWADIAPFKSQEQASLIAPQTQLFPVTAQILSHSIDHSIQISEASIARFAADIAPTFLRRVEALHDRVGGDLVEMTRRATDEADEVGRDLVDSQRLKVKRVVDTMDKMLRRRRRRFRWVRRAGWLAVEWVLVGFMWYVWFVVTVARVVLGVGRGAVGVVRWLLWL
ncbi:uncharacterized protein GGS25DRAFT_434382 [Hypoxylon fragiforme]|uniref:uncharacterized protein n=1 Tax=Hypoxylon fragiforme TaxID=63214 RepID=UPI0020C5F134|nr:uncharacterized protein GGS25DRAFT_434382 [Hypoxylon fragiforme]KAI2603783.1 hypothetical protein GGS25DRAFT_434382 [Hypoxylon fragiforme]